MSADVQVPVIMTPDAAELIQQLGLRRPIEEMIEHTRQAVPALCAVELEDWYEEAGEDSPPLPHLTIIAWHDGDRATADEATERELFAWCVRNYPPEVKQHVSFAVQGREGHGR